VEPVTWALLAAAAAVAVVNWWARARDDRRAEYVTKPAVTALVALAAVTLTPADQAMRWWFVAGFVACLAGDILLMLPRERFVAGLAAFLVAHVLFAIGFLVPGDLALAAAVLGSAVVVVGTVTVGATIVRAAASTSATLGLAVAAYIGVISAMVLAAFAHGGAWGVIGALAFYASDTLLGLDRFVAPLAAAPVGVMATYHLALAGLLLSLP
jgi:uncharacterized membrane protein YhhN